MQKVIDDIISSVLNLNNIEDFKLYKSQLLNDLEHLKKEGALIDFKFKKAFKDKSILNSLLKHTSEDLKKALSEIKIKADQLNILLNTIPALVFYKDLNLKYLMVNKAYLDFVNKTEEEVIGKTIAEVVSDYHNSSDYIKQEQVVIQTGNHIYNIFETIKHDNNIITVSTNLAPVSNTEGEIIGLVGVSLDISKQKLYEVELKKAKELAEQGMKAKSLFLANMSHEIRTPLNGIIGMSQILRKTDLNEKQNEYISTIVNSGDSLISLINDILDFSKIEEGKIEFDHRNFRIESVIKDITNILKIKAEEKGLVFSTIIDDDVPTHFNGDSYRLKQIILNLASNAIKFTNSGSVKICVKFVRKEGNKNCVKFMIVDTGIGINDEKRTKLFKSFSQIDASTTKQYGGTGLGLAISKKLTEMMSGEIGVDSKIGKGSSFWFSVLLDNIDKDAEYDIEEISDYHFEYRKGLKVLLAEDNIVNQKIAIFNLKQLGFEIVVSPNGDDAVNKFKNEIFDLILMDIQMPIMNGYDASTEIRRVEENMKGNHHIPIIALTANATKGDMERCVSAGMDAYLSKPFKPNDLLFILKEFISAK